MLALVPLPLGLVLALMSLPLMVFEFVELAFTEELVAIDVKFVAYFAVNSHSEYSISLPSSQFSYFAECLFISPTLMFSLDLVGSFFVAVAST